MVSGVLLDPGRGQPVPVLCASGSATSSMEPLYLLLAMAWLGLSQILASYSRLCFCPSTPCSLAFGASDRMLYPAPCFTAPSLGGSDWLVACDFSTPQSLLFFCRSGTDLAQSLAFFPLLHCLAVILLQAVVGKEVFKCWKCSVSGSSASFQGVISWGLVS